MRANLHELAAIVRLAASRGAEELFVQHLSHDLDEPEVPAAYRSVGEFVRSQSLEHEDPGRLREAFEEARAAARAVELPLRLPALARTGADRKIAGCDWPWRGAYITYQGLALPCCMASTPDRAQLGDMKKEGVERVWNGEAYDSFRERLASADPPDICRSCSLYRGTF